MCWKAEKKQVCLFFPLQDNAQTFPRHSSPGLCRQPRRRAHRPGRGSPRRRAPAGGPAASNWPPAEQEVKFKVNSSFKMSCNLKKRQHTANEAGIQKCFFF